MLSHKHVSFCLLIFVFFPLLLSISYFFLSLSLFYCFYISLIVMVFDAPFIRVVNAFVFVVVVVVVVVVRVGL